MTIRIDYSYMMAPAVSGGIDASELMGATDAFQRAYEGVEALRRSGEVGFADIPRDARLLEQVTTFASNARRRYDNVVLLGIGGSALGPIALRSSLRPHLWNELPAAAREGHPLLHVLDNVDPVSVDAVLRRVPLPRTLFIVTSKSGGTAETMSQFMIVVDMLRSASLPLSDHMVFVTDPEQGALRALATREGVPALDIPPNVGGRFSVLTAVGTLPAALIGIDVNALLAGAADMVDRCSSNTLQQNPAGIFATLQWLADTRHGRHIAVLMPYSDQLRELAAWFVQLWAESLGKIRPGGASVGSTPLPAAGATDQHSQVQLFMEGPADKTVAFIRVRSRGTDLAIPRGYADVKELGYLGGHSLGELIDIEQRATAGALAKRGRTNLTIELERVDPWHLGALMTLFELATAYAGQLYGVNAFDQPGVELGKQFAYALLGRPGAEAAKAEWDSLPQPDSRWTCG
jgi:glucose-6-phosphate isomerase